MTFNNELSLANFSAVAENIGSAYFDSETGEYTPQIGELYVLFAYYNNCVLVDDSEDTPFPLTDINDVEKLLKNDEFMNAFEDAKILSGRISLDFADAYRLGMDIVEQRKNGFQQLSCSFAKLLRDFGDLLISLSSSIDTEKLAELAKEISTSNISADTIVNAYQKSERFKEVVSGNADQKVVKMPDKE